MSGPLLRTPNILPVTASGEKITSALVHEGPCFLSGIKIVTDGVNDATAIIYDSLDASGKIIDRFQIAAAERYGGIIFGKAPVILDTGLYVALAGTGAKYYAFYFVGRLARDAVS